MTSKHYSFAGGARGQTDPEDIYAVTVDDGECQIERCECDHDHFVLMWSGNEYSRNNTWISAEPDSHVSLEDRR